MPELKKATVKVEDKVKITKVKNVMINSMTGFGRVVQKLPKQGSLLVEIKSGNHRFFDLNCRMPSFLSSLEIKARSLLKKSITRGSVTIYVEFSVPVNLLDVINTKRAKACEYASDNLLQMSLVLKGFPVTFPA